MERCILFRIEHFQQCTGGVAVVCILRHLVYLVQYEYGVRGTSLLYVLDNTTGHGTDVGTAMTTDFGLVVQTT